MKRSLILALLSCCLLLTGCDAFRKMAGRPTYAELEAAREAALKAEQAAHQARIDSLKQVEMALLDSLAILDSLKQQRGTVLNPAQLGSLYTTKLQKKYYIMVGAFKDRSNAERQLVALQKKGYTATLISFRNGFNAIGICPTNDLNEEYRHLRKFKEDPLCPEDVWILVNE